jgi:NAD(P)-dependent dehydrogenase (short-subunit alcohol dehydrogenase family)
MEPKPVKTHFGQRGQEGEAAVYKPSGKLQGKRALITGGDSGIGRSVAILFAMEGAKVAIIYLPDEEEDAQHTKEQVQKNGGEVVLLASDLRSAANCKDVVNRVNTALGGIDILVNNIAYRSDVQEIEDLGEEQWNNTLQTNVSSYFFMTKFAAPLLKEGSVIINSASVDSYIGTPSRVDYAASKGAVVALTRALSNQLLKRGIRVNAVGAGPVWTPMMAAGTGTGKQEAKGLGNTTPMGRVGEPVEIAACYVFLASQDSSFITGQTVHANGGIVVNG